MQEQAQDGNGTVKSAGQNPNIIYGQVCAEYWINLWAEAQNLNDKIVVHSKYKIYGLEPEISKMEYCTLRHIN